nr:hypothetical protein Ade03nite_82500 [Actinoplanes derwentensis]
MRVEQGLAALHPRARVVVAGALDAERPAGAGVQDRHYIGDRPCLHRFDLGHGTGLFMDGGVHLGGQ